MTKKQNQFIKSPLNYTGGKYKLLPQIFPIFPKKINTFVDLFCGGANVGVNAKANQIICNDYIDYLIDLFNAFQKKPLAETIQHIENRIDLYKLSKENQDGFLALRELYNRERQILDLYVLVCYSFNHVIRFNQKHKFNAPFGKNRSHFSPVLKEKLIHFITAIKEKNIQFTNGDFEMDISGFSEDDFFYCDPPYLISQGVYNDGKRGFEGWSASHETRLLRFLDKLTEKNIKFALSNVFENKGLKNDLLINWCGEHNYFVNEVTSTYGNSNYHRKDRGASLEVLVTNYDLRSL